MSHISAFVKNKTEEEHFIQTSCDSTQEVSRGQRGGVAGPRNNPSTGSDVAPPTFFDHVTQGAGEEPSRRGSGGEKRWEVPFKPAAFFHLHVQTEKKSK